MDNALRVCFDCEGGIDIVQQMCGGKWDEFVCASRPLIGRPQSTVVAAAKSVGSPHHTILQLILYRCESVGFFSKHVHTGYFRSEHYDAQGECAICEATTVTQRQPPQ